MIEPPPRLARRPRDARGYVIPWNVLIGVGGAPIFTVNDDQKQWTALTFELCPLCGEANGREMWFVGGPQSAFDPDGWYIDLPAHQECAEFALQTCPYLAAPRYEGRIDIPGHRCSSLWPARASRSRGKACACPSCGQPSLGSTFSTGDTANA